MTARIAINGFGRIISSINFEPEYAISAYIGYQLGCVKEICMIESLLSTCKGNINELFITPSNMLDQNDQYLAKLNMQ